MTRLYKLLKQIHLPLFTGALLIIPVAFYALRYIPNQEKYFTDHNLRALADLSRGFSDKLLGLQESIVNVTLKRGESPAAVGTERAAEAMRESIENIESVSLKSIRVVKGSFQITGTATDNQAIHAQTILRSFQAASSAEPLYHFDIELETNQRASELHIDFLGRRLAENESKSAADSFYVELSIHAQLKNLISPLLPPKLFDDLMVIAPSNGNRVVYQHASSDYIAFALDSLIEKSPGQGLQTSLAEARLGNRDFKLFIQPVRLTKLSRYAQGAQGADDQSQRHEWLLVGLVDAHKFAVQTRSISYTLIAAFAFAVILILLTMPFLKLRLLGRREELRLIDILFAAISLFIMTGVLVLMWIYLSTHFTVRQRLDASLDRFANEIKTSFRAEIQDAIEQLQVLNGGSGVKTYISPQALLYDARFDSLQTAPDSIPYPFFRQIAWLESSGKQIDKLGTRAYVTPKVDVSARPYFYKMYPGGARFSPWHFQRDSLGNSQPFFVQSIISITTSDYSAVVSIPVADSSRRATDSRAPKPVVAALTTRFISLMDPVLPEGFGFSIIDENGLTIFHHDKNRNLKENLFIECDGDAGLESAVASRREQSFNIKYHGRGHRFRVTPIQDTPWMLVTFADLHHIRAAELNALALTSILFSILLLLCLTLFLALYGYRFAWVIIGGIIVLLFFLQIYTAFVVLGLSALIGVFHFKGAVEPGAWFYPRPHLSKTYRITIIFLTTALAVATNLLLSENASLTVAFLLPLTMLALVYILLIRRMHHEFLRRFLGKFHGWIVYGLAQFIFIAVGVFGVIHEWPEPFQKSGFFLSGGLILGPLLCSKHITSLVRRKSKQVYYGRYVVMCVLMLLFMGLIPTTAFFKMSHEHEMKLLLKRTQLKFLHDLEQRERDILYEIYNEKIFQPQTGKAVSPEKVDLLTQKYLDYRLRYGFKPCKNIIDKTIELTRVRARGVYTEYLYPLIPFQYKRSPPKKTPPRSSCLPDSLKNLLKQARFFDLAGNDEIGENDAILGKLRTVVQFNGRRDLELYHPGASDALWSWQKLTNQALLLQKESANARGLAVMSERPRLERPFSWQWIFGVLTTVFLLFMLLRYLVRHVFASDRILPLTREHSKKGLLAQNTIYIGQPDSGKSDFVNAPQEKLKACYRLDLRDFLSPKLLENELKAILKSKTSCVVLDHFDVFYRERAWQLAKLKLLEALSRDQNRLLVVISSTDPSRRWLEHSGADVSSEAAGNGARSAKALSDRAIDFRWRRVFGSFAKAWISIDGDVREYRRRIDDMITELRGEDFAQDTPSRQESRMRGTLVEECYHTLFLRKLGEQFARECFRDPAFVVLKMNENAVISEVSARAENYYRSIWQTCTIDEKITLIHLARNSYLTPGDSEIVRPLHSRGLVRQEEHKLVLMNESFRGFVLAAESNETIEAWQEQHEHRGWEKIKSPLLTLLTGVALFLFFTQREAFNEWLALLSAMTAFLPVTLKFLRQWGGGMNRTPADSRSQ